MSTMDEEIFSSVPSPISMNFGLLILSRALVKKLIIIFISTIVDDDDGRK
jgi:hypothetical protein